jgi:hypothetical protein
LNIFMASNEDKAAHVEEGDVRYWVLECDPLRRMDTVYYGRFTEQARNGGREAFLYFLLTRDVADFIPQTNIARDNEAHKEMTNACLNRADIRKWLEDCCLAGEILGVKYKRDSLGSMSREPEVWEPGLKLTMAEMMERYLEWQKGVRDGARAVTDSVRDTGKKLKALGFTKQRASSGSRLEYYFFPTRAEFMKKLGLEWEGEEDIPEEPLEKPTEPPKRPDGVPGNPFAWRPGDEESPEHGSSRDHPMNPENRAKASREQTGALIDMDPDLERRAKHKAEWAKTWFEAPVAARPNASAANV